MVFENFCYCSLVLYFLVMQTSRLISNVIVVPGGAEQRKAKLGAPKWGAPCLDHCGRHGEQSKGQTAAGCWWGQETACASEYPAIYSSESSLTTILKKFTPPPPYHGPCSFWAPQNCVKQSRWHVGCKFLIFIRTRSLMRCSNRYLKFLCYNGSWWLCCMTLLQQVPGWHMSFNMY